MVGASPDYTIYALIDPRDSSPFYVGRTRHLAARIRAHHTPSEWAGYGAEYGLKMQELRDADIRAVAQVLEITKDWSREEFHIKEMIRRGFTLVNTYKTSTRPPKPVRLRATSRRAANRVLYGVDQALQEVSNRVIPSEVTAP